MQRIFRMSTMLVAPLVATVIVAKPLVISLLYSSAFTASLAIMRWMLVGGYLKVTSWILAMPMLAFADMKTFFWTEVMWHAAFLTISIGTLLGGYSLEGIGVAFMMAYLIYLAYTFHYARTRHGFALPRSLIFTWLGGLALVLGASWQTWVSTRVMWTSAVLWMGAGFGFVWLALSAQERRQIRLSALSMIRT
jgi:O-antigen/teichoic acid export membrane protein